MGKTKKNSLDENKGQSKNKKKMFDIEKSNKKEPHKEDESTVKRKSKDNQDVDLRGNSEREIYLSEISKLLNELDKLDQLLKKTSLGIKGERQQKEELKAEMKKVEDLIQNKKGIGRNE